MSNEEQAHDALKLAVNRLSLTPSVLIEALDKVLALHTPTSSSYTKDIVCRSCYYPDGRDVDYPCDTVEAITELVSA